MKKALSVDNVRNAKFNVMNFDGKWLDAFGKPEMTGSIIIYGDVKQGKTDFGFQFAKYLTKFGRVAYDSIEEGLSKTIQITVERNNMNEVGKRFIFLDKEPIDELKERLKKHRAPDIIVIDSVQFSEIKFSEYKVLKNDFKHKLFIYISHIKNNNPEGSVAMKIYRDANIICHIEGFRMFPISRFGGGQYINISNELASEYWGLDNQKN
ncbi:MAG: hypothetical protein FWH36_02280 [Lentimicrobiaceae bacterium]|nr:hypothetical protein [Lentimicrobiaceae bacterium]